MTIIAVEILKRVCDQPDRRRALSAKEKSPHERSRAVQLSRCQHRAGREQRHRRSGEVAGAYDVSLGAVAQEPAALSDDDRLRRLSRLLVPLRRSLEAAALCRNAGPDAGCDRMAEQGSDLRA